MQHERYVSEQRNYIVPNVEVWVPVGILEVVGVVLVIFLVRDQGLLLP